MPSVVIVGAGPIGLYTAIRLKKKYPDLEVKVFDKYAGSYTRPGVIAKAALTDINNSFEQQDIATLDVSDCGGRPAAIYIRDLQASLLERAQTLGVIIEPEDYVTLNPDGSLCTRANPRSAINTHPPCNMIIDCTGEARAVVSKFMQQTTIAENPSPNHFIAYIDVDADNEKKMKPATSESFERLSKFRSATDWKEFTYPKMDNPWRKWDRPRGTPEENGVTYTAGYCLYFETPDFPDDEDRDQMEQRTQYLQSVLHLYTGQDITFRPSTEFGAFQPFTVNPKQLDKLVDNSRGIPIIALGDAMISAEYTQGTGVRNGVACANGLTDSLQVNATSITVVSELWESKITPVLNRHKKEIVDDYTIKKNRLSSSGLMDAYHSYNRYKGSLGTSLESSEVIKNAKELTVALKDRGDMSFRTLKSNEVAINRCIEFYIAALDLCDQHPEDPEFGDIKTRTLSNFGRLYFSLGKFNEAVSFLQQSSGLAQMYNQSMLEPAKIPSYLRCAQIGKDLSVLGKGDQLLKKTLLDELLTYPHPCLRDTDRPFYQSELKKINTELASMEATRAQKSAIPKKKEPTQHSSEDAASTDKKSFN